jgi:CRISPR/Cas system CMR subunit Cmr6 (Cas7 group RAMP superfamily)
MGSKKRGRKGDKGLKVFNTKISDKVRENNFSADDPAKALNKSDHVNNKAKKVLNKSFENLKSANRLQIKVSQPHVMSAQDSVVNSHSSHYT